MTRIIIVLGDVDGLTSEALLTEGRATQHVCVHVAGGRHPASRQIGAARTLTLQTLDMTNTADVRTLTTMIEDLERSPGLVEVASAAMPGVMRFLEEGRIFDVLARRGHGVTMVFAAPQVANSPTLGFLERNGRLEGVEVVGIAPQRRHLNVMRIVPCLSIGAKIASALERGHLTFPLALFAPVQFVAWYFEVTRPEAIELQLQLVDAVARFRSDIFGVDGSVLTKNLISQRKELRQVIGCAAAYGRDVAKGIAATSRARSESGVAQAETTPPGAGSSTPPTLRDAAAEIRTELMRRWQPSAGHDQEDVAPPTSLPERSPTTASKVDALVPYYDRKTGLSGVVPIDARLADFVCPPTGLEPTRAPNGPVRATKRQT